MTYSKGNTEVKIYINLESGVGELWDALKKVDLN